MALPSTRKGKKLYQKGQILFGYLERAPTCFSGALRVTNMAKEHLAFGPIVLEEHVGNHQEVLWSHVNKQGCLLKNTAITERVGTPPVVSG